MQIDFELLFQRSPNSYVLLDQQMIGIVSHDLRNPLNAIGLATALLLQRGRLDEQHVTIVRRIMSSLTTRGGPEEILMEVHNDGTPIAPEDRSRLFEPFQRGVAPGSGGDRSIGLGLFIASQIAKSHGGSIAVHSTAEEGTLFTVRLPRRPPAAQ